MLAFRAVLEAKEGGNEAVYSAAEKQCSHSPSQRDLDGMVAVSFALVSAGRATSILPLRKLLHAPELAHTADIEAAELSRREPEPIERRRNAVQAAVL